MDKKIFANATAEDERKANDFIEQANQEYKKLKKNKKEWKKEQQELQEWDITLEDGLSNL